MILASQAHRLSDEAHDDYFILLRRVSYGIEENCKAGRYKCYFDITNVDYVDLMRLWKELENYGYKFKQKNYEDIDIDVLIIEW